MKADLSEDLAAIAAALRSIAAKTGAAVPLPTAETLAGPDRWRPGEPREKLEALIREAVDLFQRSYAGHGAPNGSAYRAILMRNATPEEAVAYLLAFPGRAGFVSWYDVNRGHNIGEEFGFGYGLSAEEFAETFPRGKPPAPWTTASAAALALARAGTTAFGGPITPEQVARGQAFFAVYRERLKGRADATPVDLAEYLCLVGYWHERASDYFGAGDPNCDPGTTPEALLPYADLGAWLSEQEARTKLASPGVLA